MWSCINTDPQTQTSPLHFTSSGQHPMMMSFTVTMISRTMMW